MPEPDTTTPPAPPAPPVAKVATTIRVRVPQESGEIVIDTFDALEPHRFTVTGGYVAASTQADADLLVARVDGASIS